MNSDGGNPDYVATEASDGTCTRATDCGDDCGTCEFDSAGNCPDTCESTDAIAVGEVVSCGYAPIVAIVADHEDWPAPGWFGGTITRDASLVSPQQCQDLCAATADCDYFSYEWELTAGEMYHECYLKEAYTDPMCMSAPGTTNPYVPWGSQDSAWHGHSSVERSSLPVSFLWKTFLTFFCCTAAPRCARAPAPPRLQRPAARRRRPRARPSQASRPRCSHWPPFTRSRRSCTDREMKWADQRTGSRDVVILNTAFIVW